MDVDINTARIVLNFQNYIWVSKAAQDLWKPCTQHLEPEYDSKLYSKDQAQFEWSDFALKSSLALIMLYKPRIKWSHRR